MFSRSEFECDAVFIHKVAPTWDCRGPGMVTIYSDLILTNRLHNYS